MLGLWFFTQDINMALQRCLELIWGCTYKTLLPTLMCEKEKMATNLSPSALIHCPPFFSDPEAQGFHTSRQSTFPKAVGAIPLVMELDGNC